MKLSEVLILCAAAQPFALAQVPAIDVPIQTQYTTKFADIRVGTGPRAEPGKVYVFNVAIWLANGKKMNSTYDGGVPASFEQGKRQAVPGLDVGFEGMRVGGKRRLFVPYQLSTGEKGGGGWPPKMDLIYDVELLDVRDPVPLRKASALAGAHYEGISADQPTGSCRRSRRNQSSRLTIWQPSPLTANYAISAGKAIMAWCKGPRPSPVCSDRLDGLRRRRIELRCRLRPRSTPMGRCRLQSGFDWGVAVSISTSSPAMINLLCGLP